MRIFFIYCCAFLLVACGDPYDTKLPDDISKWSTTVKPALQKMSPEERILFTDYVRRHTAGTTGGLVAEKADPIPADMTIGKAIAEQRSYNAREQAKAPGENPPPDKK